MAFNITDVLKSAAAKTAQEQIVYLPLDDLIPDEKNFYSLAGLDDLAASIELLGLQQPLRVRPAADGRFTIVSGHRRRAAILLIRDGGSKQFDGGVPCIVDYGEASDAMQELALIFANAQTRVLTAADTMKQTERVEELLYELKAQGVEFPGRMREHVAKACQISETKLARLKAIRNNLDEGLLAFFDAGEMAEETAYQLSRLPADIQSMTAEELRTKRKKLPQGNVVASVNRYLDDYLKEMPCVAHAGGPDCHFKKEKIVRSLFQQYDWNVCGYGASTVCCRTCYKKDTCSGCCPEQKARQKLDKAIAKEKEAEQKRCKEAEQESRRRSIRIQAKRLLPLIEKAGLKDADNLPGKYGYNSQSIKALRKYAANDFGNEHFYDNELIPNRADILQQWADKLHCTTDYLLGRTKDPQPVSESDTGMQWQTGTPKAEGNYVILFGITPEENQQTRSIMIASWTGECFASPRTNVPVQGTVYRWVKLPEV